MDIGGWIGEKLVETMFVPADICRLQRRRVVVAWFGSALAADDAGERWTDLVLARLCRMAGGAALEYLLPRRSAAGCAGR
jgi:hypothetical protein